jgi:hypothetical protein
MSFPNETLESLWAPWRFEYFKADKSIDFFTAAARIQPEALEAVYARLREALAETGFAGS